jgi:pimeloyl-ACP methyl ester carboxylesterase
LCRRLLHERAGLTGAQAEQVVRAFTRGTTWRRFTIERRQLRRDAQQLNRRLGEIQCPTFVIAGRNDHVVSYPIVSALAARLPDAQLVSTDTGHLIPIDDPQAVLDTVLRAHERAPEIPRRRDATSPTQPRK